MTSLEQPHASSKVPDAPEVSIIIVNWNSAGYLRKCLQSIYLHTRDLGFEIIVVDSASYDGCGEMLATEFPKVAFIQSDQNLGFAKANNLGAERASGSALLLLNPDTELHEESIRVLVNQLWSLPQAGAVGCKLLNADGSLQTSCVQAFPTVLNQALDSEFFRRIFPRWGLWGMAPLFATEPTPAQAVSGACILIKRQVFDLVGGFSDYYFMYGEDLDLCFKVRQAGYVVYHVSETTIVHFGGGSTQSSRNNFSNVMMRESVYRFLRHNRGDLIAAFYRVAMAAASIVRMLLLLPSLLRAGNRAHRPGAASLRKWLSIFRWSLGLQPMAPV